MRKKAIRISLILFLSVLVGAGTGTMVSLAGHNIESRVIPEQTEKETEMEAEHKIMIDKMRN